MQVLQPGDGVDEHRAALAELAVGALHEVVDDRAGGAPRTASSRVRSPSVAGERVRAELDHRQPAPGRGQRVPGRGWPPSRAPGTRPAPAPTPPPRPPAAARSARRARPAGPGRTPSPAARRRAPASLRSGLVEGHLGRTAQVGQRDRDQRLLGLTRPGLVAPGEDQPLRGVAPRGTPRRSGTRRRPRRATMVARHCPPGRTSMLTLAAGVVHPTGPNQRGRLGRLGPGPEHLLAGRVELPDDRELAGVGRRLSHRRSPFRLRMVRRWLLEAVEAALPVAAGSAPPSRRRPPAGRARSRHGRHCASRPRVISPARSSTFRCRDTAGRLIANGAASSVTVASPRASRSRIARRVGSDRAANVLLSSIDRHRTEPPC